MGRLIEDPSLRDKFKVFMEREEAGERLSEWLKKFVDRDTITLAIPSGGVPVGKVVSQKLGIPFDIIIVRKIPLPGETESGFGAMSFDGEVFLNAEMVEALHLTQEEIEQQKEVVERQIERRLKIFRKGHPFPDIKKKTVVLVDDGLASGYTMLAAISSVKKRGAKKIIVAVPTAPLSTVLFIQPKVDLLMVLNIRDIAWFAVADAYKNWYDLSEEEVLSQLKHD